MYTVADSRNVCVCTCGAVQVVTYYRARGGLMAQFTDTGMGHCEHSERAVRYTAGFIAAAARARIPAVLPPPGTPVPLQTIAQASGWLTDNNIKHEHGRVMAPAAPFGAYAGNRSQTNWHFDGELAALWMQLQTPIADARKTQTISLTRPVAALADLMHPDGTFVDPLPFASDSGSPVHVLVGMGHAAATADNRSLVWRFNAFDADNSAHKTLRGKHADGYWDHHVNLWLTADGTDHYRPVATAPGSLWWSGPSLDTTLDVAMEGRAQNITFPPVGPLAEHATVLLHATSDAGLPIEYIVVSGPGRIVGRTLTTLSLPAGGARALPLTVGAVQRGNGTFHAAAVQWQTVTVTRPAPPQNTPPRPPRPSSGALPLDVPVVLSAYLADGGNATSVQVLGTLGVVVVGGFTPLDASFGVSPTVLLDGTTGTLVFVDPVAGAVAAVTRIGARVDDVSCQDTDAHAWRCAVVGAHGAAVVEVDASTFATTIVWQVRRAGARYVLGACLDFPCRGVATHELVAKRTVFRRVGLHKSRIMHDSVCYRISV